MRESYSAINKTDNDLGSKLFHYEVLVYDFVSQVHDGRGLFDDTVRFSYSIKSGCYANKPADLYHLITVANKSWSYNRKATFYSGHPTSFQMSWGNTKTTYTYFGFGISFRCASFP